MTEAPDLIFWNQQFNHHNHVSTGHFAGGTSYTRTDLAKAMVAAAYEAAAQRCQAEGAAALKYPEETIGHTYCEDAALAIRALTPDDARAALDAMIKQAVLEMLE